MDEWKVIETVFGRPWLDIRLSKKTMDYLWNVINNPAHEVTDANNTLVGHVSNSYYLQDKENLFYKNVLKELSEYVYYKDWNNYYDDHIAKIKPPTVFNLKSLWVNYQKQYEFNPPHNHDGAFSFVVFMKIPTHWKEQHSLPLSSNTNKPCASDFCFLMGQEYASVGTIEFPLSPEDEGRMLFFPAWLLHQVFPFYGTEEERITLSGNIVSDVNMQKANLNENEMQLESMEKQLRAFKSVVMQSRKQQVE